VYKPDEIRNKQALRGRRHAVIKGEPKRNGDVGMSPVERKLRGTRSGHYEGGHRVPTVAWWPGKVPAGKKSDAFLLGFDPYPTFTETAGIADDNRALQGNRRAGIVN
jgi:arylsulfatase A-like enzyme